MKIRRTKITVLDGVDDDAMVGKDGAKRFARAASSRRRILNVATDRGTQYEWPSSFFSI
jgi:hypothetical protein